MRYLSRTFFFQVFMTTHRNPSLRVAAAGAVVIGKDWGMEAQTIWPSFCRRHFQLYFLINNCFNFIQMSLKCDSQNSIDSYIYIYIWDVNFVNTAPRDDLVILQPADILMITKLYLTMMTSSNENIFRVTGPLCGDFTGPRWILLTKASYAELWCFLWSASE